MEKEIGFSGINLTPYTDISPDGQLAYSHGLEMHNGSLRPSLLAGNKFSLFMLGTGAVTDYKLMTIHRTSAYAHLIFVSDSRLLAWGDESGIVNGTVTLTSLSVAYDEIYQIGCVGNTLVVLTSAGARYYLWTGGGYKFLGTKIPELKMRFSLVQAPHSDLSTENYDGLTCFSSSDLMEFRDAELGTTRDNVTTFFLGNITRFVEDQKAKGNVCCPFFIRYCYRLFDGTTYTLFSNPVLMIPNSVSPVMSTTVVLEKSVSEGYQVTLHASFKDGSSSRIYYKIDNAPSELQEWTDIISNVQVSMTPQVYPFRQDVNVYRFYRPGETAENGFRITASVTRSNTSGSSQGYQDSDFLRRDLSYEVTTDSSGSTTTNVRLETKNAKDFENELLGLSQFYKVAEFSISEVLESSGWQQLLVTGSSLSNLVMMESAEDSYDYRSHDRIIAEGAFVYNQRLHLFDASYVPFGGFALPYQGQYFYESTARNNTLIYTYLHAGNGTDRVVCSEAVSMNFGLGQFLYYPSTNAYKMVINAGAEVYSINLSPHPFLNGAYAIGWTSLDLQTASLSTVETNVDSIAELNKLYVSEVGNPFVFPPGSIYTVGTGRILGVSNIATPLSQGQFGQFPLLVFCSDGNFAMSVSSEGSYTTVAPIQRDVCITPSTITQTDREVVFISDRGVMMTDGTSLRCLSQAMDGPADSMPDSPPKAFYMPVSSLSTLLSSALIAYDYEGQRLLFFLDRNHCFVLSLESNTWSTANFGHAVQVLNVFPYSYVQFEDGTVYRLHRPGEANVDILRSLIHHDDTIDGRYATTAASAYTRTIDCGGPDAEYDYYTDDLRIYDGGGADAKYDEDDFSADDPIYEGVFFTRPLKLDTYQLKRLSQFALQGVTSLSHKVFLYGSQDGSRWLSLGSTAKPRARLVGKPFKYFRFAVVARLRQHENISGLRISYEPLSERRYR
jgi:hypothetical protein